MTPELVLVVGASAGGLPALRALFGALTPQRRVAVLISTHAAANGDSRMPELLSAAGPFDVRAARDGEPVEGGRALLAPPGRCLTVDDGRLRVVDPTDGSGLARAIDALMVSVAASVGRRSVGVVLSGAGSDGAAGLAAIADAGGLAIAQAPETAAFPSMPAAAIATGRVELVAAPADMAGPIAAAARRAGYTAAALGAQAGAQQMPGDAGLDVAATEPALQIDAEPQIDAERAVETAPQDGAALQDFLARFAPPGFLVCGDGRLRASYGGANRLLTLSSGAPLDAFAALVPPAARDAVQRGLGAASRTLEPHLARLAPGVWADLAALRFHPLRPAPGAARPSIYVEALATRSGAEAADGAQPDDAATAVSETRAAAFNDELIQKNEELNALNDELHSINLEYKRRNDEFQALNTDMEALLSTLDVGVVIVDDMIRIRRASGSSRRLFNIENVDIGLPLGRLAHVFHDVDVVATARETIAADERRDLEVQSVDGHWWRLRFAPFVSTSLGVRGAVVKASPIERLKRAELSARRQSARALELARLANAFAIELDASGALTAHSAELDGFVGRTTPVGVADTLLAIAHADDRPRLASAWRALVESSAALDATFRLRTAQTARWRHVRAAAEPPRAKGAPIVVAISDVESVVQAESITQARAQTLSAVMSATNSLMSYVGADRRYKYVNAAYERQWGVAAADVVGMTVDAFLPAHVYATAAPYIEAALRGRRSQYPIRYRDDAGRARTLMVSYEPNLDAAGDVLGFAVHSTDVTDVATPADPTDAPTAE